jgi:hypothetical protein
MTFESLRRVCSKFAKRKVSSRTIGPPALAGCGPTIPEQQSIGQDADIEDTLVDSVPGSTASSKKTANAARMKPQTLSLIFRKLERIFFYSIGDLLMRSFYTRDVNFANRFVLSLIFSNIDRARYHKSVYSWQQKMNFEI